ncbi:MAG: transcriptional regulator PpsR [Sphingomonadaceae bacterium]|nr:transcriptional regulator PpsR [Sphingomonadaceae bacterium]
MNLETTSGDQIPFSDPEVIFEGFTKEDIIKLAYCAGDFMLAIDEHEIIRDIAVNIRDHAFANQWIGRKWSDTVTVESKPKIAQLLEADHHGPNLWRQVNHLHEGEDVPVNYKVIKPQKKNWHIAVGRDLRAISVLQQRLLKTQQSMERDYLHLRQTETRYRLLFDNISYPVLIADADDLDIQQANRACHTLVSAAPGALEGKSLLTLVEEGFRDDVIGYIGAVSVNSGTPPVNVRLTGRTGYVKIAASAFRQSGKQYWLVNIDDGLHAAPGKQSDRYILDVVEKMPDAFVLTDEKQAIIVANSAFAELVQAGSVEQLIGVSLNRFIGRPDVDIGLLKKQLKDYHNVRNFGSIVNDLNGGSEPVEISAIMIERDQPLFGYSVRSVGRRERDLPEMTGNYPRSVEQLTELVGRKPLKEIVRESTDLIERMCIEAALVHTADNRASAAEILGLSRQSLYSKLHRHGLGNLIGKD